MITKKYLKGIGLDDNQISQISHALKKESKYRKLLGRAGIKADHAESIVSVTDLSNIELGDDATELEKIKVEWGDLIPSKKQ